MKNKVLVATYILPILLLPGCIGFQEKQNIIEGRGTIKYISLEGGFYGIIGDRGDKYFPLNLPEEFRQDCLRVEFKAKIRKDVATIQMWGVPVELIEIKKAETQKTNLSQVKVAVLYESVTHPIRGIDEVIYLLKETRADFIFRGFWRWNPCPNKCEDLRVREKEKCKLRNYSYFHLEKAILEIKKEIPQIIFCGAIPAQVIHREAVFNPLTKEVIRYPKTWNLALNPEKWGIKISKEQFQCMFAKTHFWVPEDLNCSEYSPQTASAYFPDLTNPEFKELLLSWAERQIDAGADCIWIDMLFKQAAMLYKLTKNFNHPAVKESYEAACEIVDKIHEYAQRKGKRVWVGSWLTPIFFPYTPPKLDFVTISPSSKEVRKMKMDEKKWNEKVKLAREKLGDIPIFAFIDWASTTRTPLGTFSQTLTKEEQIKFLKIADEFFTERGILFVYPLHGGWMGNDAEILSYGKSRVYDALAPEFQTYNAIKELAKKRADNSEIMDETAEMIK